ncbi:MAG: EAL domain-containing protein [Lachnospiraceae bacterium]|nr:EAL domain-containing protein [Lachnospiraceae bacterium]
MSEVWITLLHTAGIVIATFLLGVAILACTFIQRRTDKKQNRAFIWLVALVMFNSLNEIAIVFSMGFYPEYAIAERFLLVNRFLYFLTHCFVGVLFLNYVLLISGIAEVMLEKVGRIWIYLSVLPQALSVILVLSNPFTNVVYSVDANTGAILRGGGETVIYINSIIYFVLALILILSNWRSISKAKKWMMMIFLIFMGVGVFLQIESASIRAELFAEMLALLGAMALVENEDDRVDSSSGVYNRAAFLADLKTSLHLIENLNAICVRITNADTLQRLLGASDTDSMIHLVSEYLRSVQSRQYIYRTSPDSFIMIRPGSIEEAEDLADRIAERFDESFEFQDTSIMLQAVVMCACVPGDFETVDELMLLCDGPLPNKERDKLFTGENLEYLVRRAEVELALHRGLAEHRFEVYYQPVYRIQGLSIYSAEALLRLRDSKIGNIMPDEFIPIAEQNGLIDRLGDYVLEEVCLFLSSGIPMEMGLDCIEINLSVVQCLQPGFVKRVRDTVRKYDIPPRFINFEVTESAAASDYSELDAVLNDLKASGFLLSLDDYGIGYSNVRSVFSLDFDLVKIDKSILWEVRGNDEENGGKNKGRVILENSVRMIREMQLKILVEGVETQEQLELLETMDIDYLQGFYFSRPVSKNELLGILRVTELARMEEQRARAASEAKSNFLANMSHEIRTPINAILGMNEMILRETRRPQIREYAQNIEGAGRTLVSLINDILDFSKIESGSMEILESEYDLSSVINDVVNMVQIRAKDKKLEFNIQVNPKLPDNLFGDGMRLRQIMVNILNNAVKYTQKGKVELEVDGRIPVRDTLILIVKVRDTGIGIREEDLGKLFEKFQRLDESQNRNIEGSGLGLAITNSLLQLMHGEIEAKSEYGKGSEFIVRLPQKILRNDAIGDFRRKYEAGVRDHEEYRESFTAPDANILIVDDTPVNHMVIRELLKKTKIRIDTAMSGKECLEMVQNKRYDLIFLDFRMPEMDGIETLHIMRTLSCCPNEATPVIALTANAVTGARERFLSEGFDEYMIKPVDGPKLEEMLIRMLPHEKVFLSEMTPDREEAGGEEEMLGDLGDIDTSIGLKNCGSVEGYRNVLKIYYDGLQAKANEIESYYDAGDWDNYTIQVHALKSSSRVIGASELSSMAAELEKAGNEGNLDRIREDTGALLAKYRSYGNILAALFEVTEEEAKKADDLPEISGAMLKDAYDTMKDFVKMYDYDSMIDVLDSLKEYRLPEEDAEKIARLREYTEALRWENMTELLG